MVYRCCLVYFLIWFCWKNAEKAGQHFVCVIFEMLSSFSLLVWLGKKEKKERKKRKCTFFFRKKSRESFQGFCNEHQTVLFGWRLTCFSPSKSPRCKMPGWGGVAPRMREEERKRRFPFSLEDHQHLRQCVHSLAMSGCQSRTANPNPKLWRGGGVDFAFLLCGSEFFSKLRIDSSKISSWRSTIVKKLKGNHIQQQNERRTSISKWDATLVYKIEAQWLLIGLPKQKTKEHDIVEKPCVVQ